MIYKTLLAIILTAALAYAIPVDNQPQVQPQQIQPQEGLAQDPNAIETAQHPVIQQVPAEIQDPQEQELVVPAIPEQSGPLIPDVPAPAADAKSDLDTANTFWGGYGYYRPRYYGGYGGGWGGYGGGYGGGWRRGWGGGGYGYGRGFGGWGGYGWGGGRYWG